MITIYYYYKDESYSAIYSEYDLEKVKRFIAMLFSKKNYGFDCYSCDDYELNFYLDRFIRMLQKKYYKR